MNRIIRRESDDVDFVTTHRLGSGLLAVVYAAKSSTGEQIAVKVPASNLSREQFGRFQEEYELLDKMSEATDSVPKAWWGRDTETDGRVLLLEMAPDNKLSEHLHGLTGLEKEQVALEAAVHYVKMLQALHKAEKTCADRKLGDLRWEDQTINPRLVVLDWNAVRPASPEGIQEDIYTFASLWYQMLTQRYAHKNLSLLDESAWADDQISIGTRAILLRGLSSDSELRYQNIDSLLSDIEQWFKDFQQDGAFLYEEGSRHLAKVQEDARIVEDKLQALSQTSRGSATSTEIPTLLLETENEALAYLDLAWRKEYSGAYEPFQQSLTLVKSQSERLLDSVRLAFAVGQLTAADRSLEWAEQTMAQATRRSVVDPTMEFAVKRWAHMLHINNMAIDQGILLRDYRHDLADALTTLQQADQPQPKDNWQNAETKVSRVVSRLRHLDSGNQIVPLLMLYQIEAQSRLHISRADQAEATGHYEQAIQEISQAIVLFNQVADAGYSNDLIQHLNLEDRHQRLQTKAQVAKIKESVKDDMSVEQWIQYRQQRLRDALPYMDSQTRQSLIKPSDSRLIILVQRIKDNLAKQQWLDMAHNMAELLDSYGTQPDIANFVKEAVQIAMPDIVQLAKMQKDDVATLELMGAFKEVSGKLGTPTPSYGRM